MKTKNLNPKTGKAFQWNGLLIEQARFGYVIQEPNNEKPLYWYNCEVDRQKKNGIEPCVIPAIEILAKDEKEPFCIANIAGVGIMKLEAGGMWTHQHLSLDGKFYEDEAFAIYEYDKIAFGLYITALEAWQETNYPDEFAKMKAMKQSFEKKRGIDMSKAGLVDAKGNKIERTINKSGATSLHEKFRKGKR